MKDAKSNIIFGYKTIYDFLYSNFGLQTPLPHFVVSIIFGIIGQATTYSFETSFFILVLGITFMLTSLTGIVKSIKYNIFTSTRLPRILIRILLYTIILGLSWKISHINNYFNWVPGVFYGYFLSILLMGSLKNICRLFMFEYYDKIKKRLNSLTHFHE